MSGLMDKVEGVADNKLNQDAQPGDSVERTADSDVNNGTFQPLLPVSSPQSDADIDQL